MGTYGQMVPEKKMVLKFQVLKKTYPGFPEAQWVLNSEPYPSLPEAKWVLNSAIMDFNMKKVV